MDNLDRLFNQIKKEKDRLDILFANAATGGSAPLRSITEEHFDNLFNVNVKGVLFTVQKALPILVDGGSIILNASTASVKGNPGMSCYSATKAALRSFARCWTMDLKDRKIRVNTLSPGLIDTPMARRIGGSEEKAKEFADRFLTAVPMNRLGTPDEVAKAAVFLASDDSSYVTGIELFVDGGRAHI
ncbi:unnamed protein product [Rotaria sp. Silwood1]|nr:unnamed protein product [Rotaria sp. Silwood1]CAF1557772.1 unnamed protein product [Rotaria sp. Silwood1]CAF3604233.1 unnamed protein product [Rotaria sp. Silwood1]CAF3637334.1 unnamed protein product [Rotaria sp. Silwood1]CAF3640319.1 unnamed protein product [Rotaria sp. Silwood1]